MKAKKIFVEGNVQRVGYRDYIQKTGRKFDVRGYVKNDRESSFKVETLAIYNNEADYFKFLESVKNPPYPASVDKITEENVNPEQIKESYNELKIIRGEPFLELTERLDQAMYYFRGLDNKQDQMLENEDKMIQKQDLMLNKQDAMIDKQDETIHEIKNMNQNMQKRFDIMENKYGKISDALERIADALELLSKSIKK